MKRNVEKGVFAARAAAAYVGILLIGCLVFWGYALIGGNPLTFHGTQIVDTDGNKITVLKVGSSVGVRREICSSNKVGVEFFPYLRDKAGISYPLPSGMVEYQNECSAKIDGFVIPNLPAGDYVYSSTIRFRNNLVGRDEMTTSPPISVRITNE